MLSILPYTLLVSVTPLLMNNRIVPNLLVNHHDNDSPSDNGSHVLDDVEQDFIVIVLNTEFSPWYGRCKGARRCTGCNGG